MQTVVVKTFFTPWAKWQICVRRRQKVKVDTRNLARVKSDKMPFVDVLTESGREGKVPVSVLDVGSLPVMCSRLPVDQPNATQSHTSALQSQSEFSERESISSSNGQLNLLYEIIYCCPSLL